MILEDEKSLDLMSASWSPRKIGGVIQSESKGLRTGGDDGVSSNLRAGENEIPPLNQ